MWTSFHTPGGFCIPTALGLWLPEINLLHIAVTPSTYHAIGFKLFSSFLAHFHFYYLFFFTRMIGQVFLSQFTVKETEAQKDVPKVTSLVNHRVD